MIGIESVVLVALAQGAQMRNYIELAQAALLNPVRREELSAAVLAPDGVGSIQALFDLSIDASLSVGGVPVTPELGGESMLDAGNMIWVVYPDPVHSVVRQSVASKDNPEYLLGFLQGSADGRLLLKDTGGLHALLYQMSSTTPTLEQQALLETVLGRMVAQHFKTWSTDPAIQQKMIAQTQWRGRYVGFWHIHPPRLKNGSSVEGIEPSMTDMQNALELGQFLTIVFQPDGFDLYDLSALAASGRADLSKVGIIRHRSPAWRRHFDEKLSP